MSSSYFVKKFKNSFVTDILEIFHLLNIHEKPNTIQDFLSLQKNETNIIISEKNSNYNNNRNVNTEIEKIASNYENTTIIEEDENISDNKLLTDTFDPYLVTFHGPNDPDDPQNWSMSIKTLMTIEIMTLTCVTYMGSTIHTSGVEEIQKEFHVGHVVGTLNLSIYILGYGIGPMFFAPLSEFAKFGRQQIYILTLLAFGLLQIGCALVNNIYGLIIMRFLSGIFSSPALTTGGATMADYISEQKLTYLLGLWAIAAFAAPIIGPIIGAAMVDAMNWRWQFWILFFIIMVLLFQLIFFFPETSKDNILFRRMLRLRRITGDKRYYTLASEKEKSMTIKEFLIASFYKPFKILIQEPIALAFDLYLAVCYAIFYLYFEAFPIVFGGIYNFTLIEQGLAYLGFIVTDCFAYMILIFFTIKVINPTYTNNTFTPEVFMILPMCVSWLLPLALFFFGWTAHIHWMMPIVSEVFFDLCVFNMFQSTYAYLASCYPRYVASVFAGNGFCHAALAAGFPLFGKAMFNNLGTKNYPVAWGCSLIGFITVGLSSIPFLIYKFGPFLRSKSKFSG